MYESGLIRKVRLIPKFMTSSTGKQTITMHILPNISRSKGNRAMKFDKLVEYDMKDIFLEKPYKRESREKPYKEKPYSRETSFS